MARMLKSRKDIGGPATVLFLGSRTGRLFRLPFLADLLKGWGDRDFSNMTRVGQFRECYRILERIFKNQNLDREIHFILRKALELEKIQVEVADLCIAELMKAQIFDYIVTTNIGNELEHAFRQSAMQDPRDFEIVIPGPNESIAGKMKKGRGFKILKASGDVAAERYSICEYNIGSQEIYLKKYPELNTSLGQVKGEAMLMVGFDDKWDGHILHAIFPHENGSLWYVNEEPTSEDSLLFNYLDTYQAERLEDTTGRYEFFFTNLCLSTLGFVPSIPANPRKEHPRPSTQHDLLEEMHRLTETVNKLIEGHEAMRVDIKSLNKKVDTLLTRSTPASLSDSISPPPADSISTPQDGQEKSTRNTMQWEENEK
jgi:hypothetical protein